MREEAEVEGHRLVLQSHEFCHNLDVVEPIETQSMGILDELCSFSSTVSGDM